MSSAMVALGRYARMIDASSLIGRPFPERADDVLGVTLRGVDALRAPQAAEAAERAHLVREIAVRPFHQIHARERQPEHGGRPNGEVPHRRGDRTRIVMAAGSAGAPGGGALRRRASTCRFPWT